MHTELTSYIDVAQVALYAFWVFFAGLIIYLHREDKREGYPLIYEGRGRKAGIGFPALPGLKTYLLRGGHTSTLPNWKNDRQDAAVTQTASWPGAPYVPAGNPMLDGVGPGSYAQREDIPELSMHDIPAIVPMRADPTILLAPEDPDPRGMPVIAADGLLGGVVSEVWVDRAEMLIRYLEVEVDGIVGRKVLLPMTMAKLDRSRNRINVVSIFAKHFSDVPAIKSPDQVTKLEEDKIMGYYGAGYLYASPARQEPLI